MGLSTYNKLGYMAGGVSEGYSRGLKGVLDQVAAEEAQKRTELAGKEMDLRTQEMGLRTKKAAREEEEYQRGQEPIPVADARKTFQNEEEADYHEGFARSIGAIRKNADGTEYITKKDARDIAILMKSPELQKDKDDFVIGSLRDKVAKAEEDAKAQPELKPNIDALKRRLQIYETRTGVNKLTPVSKGTRLVDKSGKVVLESEDKDPGSLDAYLTREVNEGRMTIDEAMAKKKKGGGSGIADEIREERLQMARDEADRKKEDQQYRREERLNDDWDKEEAKYNKQYETDVETVGEEKARENWNKNVAAMRRKFAPRYREIGLNLDGTRIQKGEKTAHTEKSLRQQLEAKGVKGKDQDYWISQYRAKGIIK